MIKDMAAKAKARRKKTRKRMGGKIGGYEILTVELWVWFLEM